ncbi:tRNA1(Val) (adenine(37)-N6)-methyltransferase [Niabella aurantiaca]|uniref:tRNA1(Val) (adenine(37)-N6)-methyltransferase n=1 Tax=Niabella aurantiaca TaxID=379900 RepID=UPI0003724DE5|nr:methyltransferase [Niabella aurantiaca]
MPNPYFRFKQFTIYQDRCAMKVTTDACLFGAWVAQHLPAAAETVLDVGAGTGLLTLMIAQAGNRSIDAIELQETDHVQAAANIAQTAWHASIRLIQGDVLAHVFDRKYDAIVSNPPFYEHDLKGGQRNRNIAHHNEGLLLSDLLDFIRGQLAEEGTFFLLLPAKRHTELIRYLETMGLHCNSCCYVQQTEKHAPFRILVSGAFRKSACREERIVIRERNEYTPEFKALLSPYYLHL